MSHHILQLNFPETTNEGVLLIDDISIYSSLLFTSGSTSLPCANLQITPPEFDTPTTLSVSTGFRLIMNACTMGILSGTGCSDCCPALPDGMYNIRYSVAPTDKIYVEYKIMRIVRGLNRYYELLCKLALKPCLPDKDTEYQLRQLDIIHNYLISAKTTVENLHNFSDGIDQYKYAVVLMDKMSYEPNRC